MKAMIRLQERSEKLQINSDNLIKFVKCIWKLDNRLAFQKNIVYNFLKGCYLNKKQQAGTGPSRRHIQGSKIAKRLPSVNLQYSKIEKSKNGPSGAPGPASVSPCRAKEKEKLEKNLNCEKN